MIFAYTALTADGRTVRGTLDAPGRAEALALLDSRRLSPLALDSEGNLAAPPAGGGWWRRQGVSGSERDEFTRQLSILLSAGVPLAEALKILCDEATSEPARQQWMQLHADVVGGVSLAEAMARCPEVFARVYVAMVRAGETGGFLDVVLEQIADFQEKEAELRGQVVGALLYPLILMVVATVVVIFLLVFFIPTFQGIFAEFGAKLPALTLAIVAVGMALKQYGWLAALVLAFGGWRLARWLKTEEGRRENEQLMLRLPVVRLVISQFALVRFCRMLGTLTAAGVPLLSALRVAKESVGIQTLVDALGNAAERMQNGTRLADALGECQALFPRSVLQVVSVAEQSGSLDKELIRLGERTERELERRLKAATAILEPALLIIMAVVVGLIVIGMLLPIFTLQEYIK